VNPENPNILQDYTWASQPIPLPWWLWACLAAVAVLLAGGTALFLWKRKQQAGEESSKPLIPPHITALEALRLLEARLEEAADLEFIVEISGILRIYIQGRFHLRAPHRSTEEFLWEASESSVLSFEDQQLLGEFLGLCDRVKFARHHVALHEMKALFSTARRFVIETAEKPEPAVPAGKT
jgi:hypothetical protein